ncbi:toxin [Candidatus Peregrinibacteria bacterium]|nr:toxin [Candidatus Peregrinibacteria bacterium]
MKIISWNKEKNEKLQIERNISFDDILICLSNEKSILDVIDHPNQKKYPGQKIYIVEYMQYVYLVPYTETNEEIFLKTIIPSRKATKEYLFNN